MVILPFDRPEWSPLPNPGCRGVVARVLLREPHLFVAQLQFDEEATIHEHAAPWDIDVFCLDGRGFVLSASTESEFVAGQRIRWPAGVTHCLRTEASTMSTLMMEHLQALPNDITMKV
ncbi:MAG: hypothetical protein WEC75_04190 [Dehalococcoidia bacterium]